MSDLIQSLRAEISRLSRKENKADVDFLRKALSAQRSEIAALKRDIKAMSADIRNLTRRLPKVSSPAVEVAADADEVPRRFSAARFGAMRKRLGLTQAELATLLGTSALSVYKWEAGKARPRAGMLSAIAVVRAMPRPEIKSRLEKAQK